MKINSICYSTNFTKSENNRMPNQKVIASPISAQTNAVGIPYYAMLANSAIPFKGLGSLLPKTTTGQDLAEIVNCIYCDRPMIVSKKLFSIVWPSKEEPIKIYNKKMIEILDPLKEKMHEGELAAFETIKDLNSQYPDKTFQELLSLVRPENLEKLIAKEKKILNNINWITNELPRRFSNRIRPLIADAQSRIVRDEETHPFRRKVFIERLGSILEDLPNQKRAQSIVDKAYYLPTSKDSKSAFIVKYASKVRKADGTWAYRSTEEIAHNLLCGSRSTVDHLEAQHPQDLSMSKGETVEDNLVFACDCCNSFLKENTELPRLAKRYPKIPKNIQKHVDTLTIASNNGTIIGGVKYINGIAQKFEKLSTAEVDLRVDTSQLNQSLALNQV